MSIIGINSSGLHSNGYSLARKVLLSKYSIRDKIKGIGVLGDALLAPTEIYVRPVLAGNQGMQIHGLGPHNRRSIYQTFEAKKDRISAR